MIISRTRTHIHNFIQKSHVTIHLRKQFIVFLINMESQTNGRVRKVEER